MGWMLALSSNLGKKVFFQNMVEKDGAKKAALEQSRFEGKTVSRESPGNIT